MSTMTRMPPGAPPRPVTKRDLDREIERLALDLVARADRSRLPAGDDLLPRPVSPAELVRLVAPFLSRN